MQTSFIKYISEPLIAVLLLSLLLMGCNKTVSTATSTTTTPINPLNNDTLTDFPRIKFFTVMDYGDAKVAVNLNGNTSTIAKYYPSNYYIANKGTNSITLYYPDTTTSSVLSMDIDLISGCYYSCFFYRVGYEWKLSLVKDDVSSPSNSANAKIRVLDFRTQAYFDYVTVRVYDQGGDEHDFYNRNFLDHETYSSNALFKEVPSASNYSIQVLNYTNPNLTTRTGLTLSPGRIYSVVLMTPSIDTPAQALKDIFPDLEQHN